MRPFGDAAARSLLVARHPIGIAAYVSLRRTDKSARFREAWGKPVERWRDIEAIASYHRWVAGRTQDFYLDDRTWSDLHCDLVFTHVDRTRSTVGAQLLYHRLRCMPSEDELNRFEGLVQHFTADEAARYSAQRQLADVAHPAGYRLWSLCLEDTVQARWWYVLFPLLSLAAVGSVLAAAFVTPRALLLLLAIAGVNTTLRLILASSAFHLFRLCRQVGPFLSCANSVLLEAGVKDALDANQIASDLRSVHSLRASTKWAGRNFTIQGEIGASLWEYLNLLFLVDATAVFFATNTLQRNREPIARLIAAVGEVDAALSTASLRAGADMWTVPDFTSPGSDTELVAAWHPLVENAVANSVVLTPGRGLVITGSNMSGKSTFLRTVGVTAVLAQTLNTAPAQHYSSPRLRVRSAIGRSDDLVAGKSYYLAEVDAVLDMLDQAAAPETHLFLFDELFRGTNTVERLAAGEAVLAALASGSSQGTQHLVIAATHDGELVDLLHDRYEPYHFAETVRPDGISFSYTLESGPARSRNAIALLELQGAPEGVVSLARERVRQLDAERNDSP